MDVTARKSEVSNARSFQVWNKLILLDSESSNDLKWGLKVCNEIAGLDSVSHTDLRKAF